jgi:hypothetical protein
MLGLGLLSLSVLFMVWIVYKALEAHGSQSRSWTYKARNAPPYSLTAGSQRVVTVLSTDTWGVVPHTYEHTDAHLVRQWWSDFGHQVPIYVLRVDAECIVQVVSAELAAGRRMFVGALPDRLVDLLVPCFRDTPDAVLLTTVPHLLPGVPAGIQTWCMSVQQLLMSQARAVQLAAQQLQCARVRILHVPGWHTLPLHDEQCATFLQLVVRDLLPGADVSVTGAAEGADARTLFVVAAAPVLSSACLGAIEALLPVGLGHSVVLPFHACGWVPRDSEAASSELRASVVAHQWIGFSTRSWQRYEEADAVCVARIVGEDCPNTCVVRLPGAVARAGVNLGPLPHADRIARTDIVQLWQFSPPVHAGSWWHKFHNSHNTHVDEGTRGR